jgi:hypothetical protein
MRRDTAERIIRLVKASDDLLNELTLLTDEIEDDTERKAVRRALVELVLDVHETAIRAIWPVRRSSGRRPWRSSRQWRPAPCSSPRSRSAAPSGSSLRARWRHAQEPGRERAASHRKQDARHLGTEGYRLALTPFCRGQQQDLAQRQAGCGHRCGAAAATGAARRHRRRADRPGDPVQDGCGGQRVRGPCVLDAIVGDGQSPWPSPATRHLLPRPTPARRPCPVPWAGGGAPRP